jgi:ATP-binding cassette subfamily B protein
VPQSIFLTDATIAENIAFCVPIEQIDRNGVEEAARRAQIHDFIASLPQGYQTTVGERGVRLSGGQRQRIGIARALYRKADVLVLDEATSALDMETETSVMEGIESIGRDVTILVVAHRLATLENCDRVIDMNAFQSKVSAKV